MRFLRLTCCLLALVAVWAAPLPAQSQIELEELTPPLTAEPESLPPPANFGLKLPEESVSSEGNDAIEPGGGQNRKRLTNTEELPGLPPRGATPFRRPRGPAEELGPISPGQAEELPNMAGEVLPLELGEEEIIRERYPKGAVKIERVVRQDRDGNYVQHGPWKMYDERGRLIADGTYFHNQRDGVWRRVFFGPESTLFQSESFRGFQPPFVSEATFERGRLTGDWTLLDAQGKQVFSIALADGKRHGKSTFYYANAQPLAEIHFDQGEMHGGMTTWGRDGRTFTQKEYVHGRTLETKTERYANKQPKSQVSWYSPELKQQSADDWWNARLAEYKPVGKPLKHGALTAWHENGQVARQGEYDRDLPVGKTVWWHATGQKSVEGTFENGLACGKWTWWFDSGQKQIQGDFVDGAPRGDWVWWDTNGKVAKRGPPTSNSVLAKQPGSGPNFSTILQPFVGAISQPQTPGDLAKPPPQSFGDKPPVQLGTPVEE